MEDLKEWKQNEIWGLEAWKSLCRLRELCPLIQCITNYVSMDIMANTLLAAGASPAMVHAFEEIADFTPHAKGLCINIGTLTPDWTVSMKAAAVKAAEAQTPWVLDPVAAGAFKYGMNRCLELVDLKPTVIRGNASEILALAGASIVSTKVIVSQKYDGRAADIWSCGVILFELLAGFCPFEGSNQIEQYRKICKAEFSFPSWFSHGVRNLITRILDPRPQSRITIAQIYEDEWFKKDYYPPAEPWDEQETNSDDVHAAFGITEEHLVTNDKQPGFINAFQLIAMSKDLDFSGFFEKENNGKSKKRFGSRLSAKETMEKMYASIKSLGLLVGKVNPYKIKIHGAKEARRKGSYLWVSIEVTEVAPSFSVVEVWKSAGDTVEYIKFYKSFSRVFMDVPDSPENAQLDCPRSEEDNHLISSSCQEVCNKQVKGLQFSCIK